MGERWSWALSFSPSSLMFAIEVDRQLRDPDHRIVEPQELLDQGPVAFDDDTSGEHEVPVEPRVGQEAPVGLDAQLAEADAGGVGLRFDPQIGAVGVGSDHPEPRMGPARADLPRHQ